MNSIDRTNSENIDFIKLVAELDKDLNAINGAEQADYDEHNILENIETVAIIYRENKPVGCGAFKKLKPGFAEVKRVYITPDYRKKGLSKILIKELETWARELGYKTAVLETGKKQKAAIGLYTSCGYTVTENYPPYVGMPSSLCMAKEL